MPVPRLNRLLGLLVVLMLAGCAVAEPLNGLLPVTALEPEAPAVPEQPGLERVGQAVDKDPLSTVQLGYHYKPTQDGTSAATLARQAAFIVLTKNDESFRDELRAAGYQGKILQYILANEVDGPAPGADCDNAFEPWQNQALNRPGEFCSVADPTEDWFLHNGDGERLYARYQDRYYYRINPASPGWRAFYLARLKSHLYGDEANAPLGYDGFFFDNVELGSRTSQDELRNSDGRIREFEDEAEFRAAWRGWLEYMRDGLGPGVPLWGNMVAGRHKSDEWNEYLPFLDGGMNESFATGYRGLTREQQTNDLEQAEYVLGQGKGFYAIGQGDQDDLQKQQFALASFLLITQPDQPFYFRYTRAQQRQVCAVVALRQL